MPPSLSAARLVLYCLISSLEEDMRRAVVQHLVDSAAVVLGEVLHENSLARWQGEDTIGPDIPSLTDLLPYTDFLDPIQMLNANRSSLPDRVALHYKQNYEGIAAVVLVRNRVMHRRPLGKDDLFMVHDLADELRKQDSTLWLETSATLDRLETDPSYVLGFDIPFVDDSKSDAHNLPIPDFDETGFVGREKQLREVVGAINGPFPVASIIGEGGIGKTALALRAAYDILDMDEMPFDQIVWISAKRFYLIGEQIEEIRQVVNDSLGFIRDASIELGAPEDADPSGEVLEYLAHFRILLIMDNVETVLDTSLKEFLRLLPRGSKVLITSRIGIGEMEYVIRLNPMSNGEATHLLRSTAAVRGEKSIGTLPQSALSDYCNRMDNNPGFVKWFVAAVQAGRRPEEILAHSDVFLDFCMSNIYEHLGDDSRAILAALGSIGSALGQSELEYLTKMPIDRLQRGLQELLTTNMVVMTFDAKSSVLRSLYSIGELARKFIARHEFLEAVDDQRYQRRWKRMVSAAKKEERDHSSSPYALKSFCVRNHGDVATIRYLRAAVDAARGKDLEKANDLLEAALVLAPDYFEVYRIRGYLRVLARDVPGARSAYLEALRLAPQHPPLLRANGLFLMGISELEEAENYLRQALALDSGSVELTIDLATCQLKGGKYSEADDLVCGLAVAAGADLRSRQRIGNLRLQCLYMRAEEAFQARDYVKAYVRLRDMYDRYTALDKVLVDSGVVGRLERALPVLDVCIAKSDDAEIKRECRELRARCEEEIEKFGESKKLVPGKRYDGMVANIVSGKGYGFIKVEWGEDVFVHADGMRAPGDWYGLTQGKTVNFVIKATPKGPQAEDVVLGVYEAD